MFDYAILILQNHKNELLGAQKGCVDRNNRVSEETFVDILDYEGKIQELSDVCELLKGISDEVEGGILSEKD